MNQIPTRLPVLRAPGNHPDAGEPGPLLLQVSRVEPLTPRIRHYELRAPAGGALPPWTPGAHIEVPVRLPSGSETRRYSLMGDCERRDVYEIAVLREDQGRGGSLAVHQDYREGLVLACSEPDNRFELHAGPEPALLIAGGIGFTPLRSMAICLERRGTPFRLHVASRTEADTALKQDFMEKFGARVQFWYSSGATPNRLDVNRVVHGLAPETFVYVCGPARLVDDVLGACARIDLPSSQIRHERFQASTASAHEHAIDVHLQRSGKTIHVAAGVSILDAVLAAGIDAPQGCRSGQCGACAVDVLDGKPDHRDVALNDADRLLFDRMCICVSRAKGARLVIDL